MSALEPLHADGMAFDRDAVTVPAGVLYRICRRTNCCPRTFAPVDHALEMDENVRGLSAYVEQRHTY